MINCSLKQPLANAPSLNLGQTRRSVGQTLARRKTVAWDQHLLMLLMTHILK